MWCSVRTRSAVLVGLILALGGLVQPVGGEEVTTHATIRNAVPEITAVDVLLDARPGLFHYEVQATDANGAPDLDRVVFHLLDADDRLWTYRDTAAVHDGARATWSGIAHLGLDTFRGPFRVHVHVYDVQDASTEAEVPVTLLSAPLEDARDVRKAAQDAADDPPVAGRPLVPLMTRVVEESPAPVGLLVAAAAAAAALGLIVGIACRPRSAPPAPPLEPAQVRLKATGQRGGGRLTPRRSGPAGGPPRGR